MIVIAKERTVKYISLWREKSANQSNHCFKANISAVKTITNFTGPNWIPIKAKYQCQRMKNTSWILGGKYFEYAVCGKPLAAIIQLICLLIQSLLAGNNSQTSNLDVIVWNKFEIFKIKLPFLHKQADLTICFVDD